MIKIKIIILNWNRPKDTLETLHSLSIANFDGYEVEIVVVDNNSTDGSVSKIQKLKLKNQNYKLKVKIIKNTKNYGFAKGNNIGIKYALKESSDYIMILNNDVLVDKNFLQELMKNFENGQKIGVISPKIYFAKGYEFQKTYKESEKGKVLWYAGGDIDWNNIYGTTVGVDEVDIGRYNQEKITDFATGTCMILPRKVLEKVGFFDEKFFMYYEDTDLSVRIKKAGYRVMYEPDAVVWHKVARSSGIGSGLNDYFITRNRLLFGLKYARWRVKFALMRQSIKHLASGRKWQKIGVRDFYLMRFGQGSWKA